MDIGVYYITAEIQVTKYKLSSQIIPTGYRLIQFPTIDYLYLLSGVSLYKWVMDK